MKDFLLLTACVNPNGMAYTKLKSPVLREDQYKHALSWYLQNTDYPIIFCENTGVDFSPYFQSYINEGRLEVLTFHGNDYERSLGKGYGEAIILEYALNNSKMLFSLAAEERKSIRIIKVTGRLVCTNLSKLAKKYNRSDCVYANMGNDDWGNVICSSTVVFAPLNFWTNYFLPNRNWLNDTLRHYFEHLLWHEVMKWKQDGNKHHEFLTIPCIIGVSGTSGAQYSNPTRKEKLIHLWMYTLHRYFHYYGYLNPFYKGKRNLIK